MPRGRWVDGALAGLAGQRRQHLRTVRIVADPLIFAGAAVAFAYLVSS